MFHYLRFEHLIKMSEMGHPTILIEVVWIDFVGCGISYHIYRNFIYQFMLDV